jgi:hypothetical protein
MVKFLLTLDLVAGSSETLTGMFKFTLGLIDEGWIS